MIEGYENDGRFGPADPITREQMAVMMYRYAKSKGEVETKPEVPAEPEGTAEPSGSEESGETSVLERFPDGDSVTGFAVDAMEWAVTENIIKGTGEGYLNPLGNVNRAECAAIISRYCAGKQ